MFNFTLEPHLKEKVRKTMNVFCSWLERFQGLNISSDTRLFSFCMRSKVYFGGWICVLTPGITSDTNTVCFSVSGLFLRHTLLQWTLAPTYHILIFLCKVFLSISVRLSNSFSHTFTQTFLSHCGVVRRQEVCAANTGLLQSERKLNDRIQ